MAADIKQIVSFYRKKFNSIFARKTDRESLKLTEKLNLYGKTAMGVRERERKICLTGKSRLTERQTNRCKNTFCASCCAASEPLPSE